jgi:methylglutaconyl-CoA hydratase
MSEPLLVDIRGHVARVTLNRPDIHNAFDDDLVARLADVAITLAVLDDVRVVVLAGAGKSFSAGADLNWMKRMAEYGKEENRVDSERMAKMFEAWFRLPQPVVGRVQGAALGGGTGLVSVCDIAVSAADTVYGFTEVRLGILPAVISPFVLGRIGPGHARHLFLTGERFDAARARDIGLVDMVVPVDELDDAVDRVTRDLLSGGPDAQRRIKRLVTEVTGLSPEKARSVTTQAIAAARVSEEGQEGMHAFFARRRAAWRGDE